MYSSQTPQKTFPKENYETMKITTNLSELVYLDIYGTLYVQSLDKNNYFIIFVDDFNRKIWI